MVFIRYPFPCHQKYLDFSKDFVSFRNLKERISSYLGNEDFSLYCNGKRLCESDFIPSGSFIEVTYGLPGGKGGFGSMLRAIGAQIEKTTNREACRDLSGRRLRDINEEQRLKKWIAKEAEREADKMRRRKERLERLKSKPKHHFVDFDYEKEISTLPERVDDALTEGLQKTKNPPSKREACEPASFSKKKRLWIDEEFSSDSSNSDSELQKNNSSSENSEHTPANCGNQNYESRNLVTPIPGTSESCGSFETMDSSDHAFADNEHQSYESKNLDTIICYSSESCSSIETRDNEYEEKIDFKECENSSSFLGVCSKNQMKGTMDSNKDSSLLNEVKETGSEPIASTSSLTNICPPKEQETKGDVSNDLLSYESVSELKALGLDSLKAALIARGLKCGGNISDRAQRLWRVRGLQPHEYPTNLLVKSKK